jgi:hypothetical protein
MDAIEYFGTYPSTSHSALICRNKDEEPRIVQLTHGSSYARQKNQLALAGDVSSFRRLPVDHAIAVKKDSSIH